MRWLARITLRTHTYVYILCSIPHLHNRDDNTAGYYYSISQIRRKKNDVFKIKNYVVSHRITFAMLSQIGFIFIVPCKFAWNFYKSTLSYFNKIHLFARISKNNIKYIIHATFQFRSRTRELNRILVKYLINRYSTIVMKNKSMLTYRNCKLK